MNRRTIHIEVDEYESRHDLPAEEQHLLSQAEEASTRAYAPYSAFYVGAALELEDGTIVTGNNQENAAYPSGLCAERVAVFHASSQKPGIKIKRIAVFATGKNSATSGPVSPCGGCRQVLAEYETLGGEPVRIILAGNSGSVAAFNRISDLLPMQFDGSQLKKR